ncbi:MAG: glycoside hydrolase family 78 protein [Muribaculaceae bacterium]|nr:glycoside hydrolase family 78 protein [Muribaculaceae bacterium]
MKVRKYILAPALISLMMPGMADAMPKRDFAGNRVRALPDSVWKVSEWISVADAPVVTGRVEGSNERAADGAGWFVTKVKNSRKVISARWMTTGLGVYKLHVNGNVVGEEILKPGFTHYEKTKLSFTYDITDVYSRKSGAVNELAVQVTPGWWADKIITPGGHDGMIGKKVAFRGVLELTFSDGEKEYYGTNTDDWKAGIAGPVRHAAIFDGEEYDARELPGYATPHRLSTPEKNTEFNGGIFPSDGAEIYFREDLALRPVKAYSWNGVTGESENEYGKVVVVREFPSGKDILLRDGETLVVDFGQNCAAVPEFEFSAREGTKLRCLFSELLNDGNGSKSRGMDGPEGSCHRLNLRIPEIGMSMDYTFAGRNGYERYRPECTFYGYRFISVTADGDVRIKSIRSVPVSSISSNMETGTITTGDPSVNRLISNIVWGQRSNYLSVPTDCPQRNERLGWTADTQVFAETGTYFANTNRFFHKWMRDMRDTQHELGGFPGVAPQAQYGAFPTDMNRLGWSDAGVIVPWVVWKQYGDTGIIEENWEAMEKYLDHIGSTRYDHHAHVAENGNYQWADWLSYEPLESCSGRKDYQDYLGNWHVRPETYVYWNYLSGSYWLMDAEMMCDMAEATGRDSARYREMAEDARRYLCETFFRPDGTFLTDILNTMQTPALFALRNRLFEGEAKENIVSRLRENFIRHDNCLQTGFLGTSILMSTLTDNGMTDIAYELLFQRKNPSWLYSVDNGATTIWERWNSYMIDQGMGPQGMNSFNHYAYGCVGEWMWETMAGISTDVSTPGFGRIVMKPVPDKRLGFVKAEYDSASGRIKSYWKYDGDKWIWNFTVPQGAVAEVTLPGEDQMKEYPAGSYSVIKTAEDCPLIF